SPDLLFNGACGSKDYFQAATHGGNTSLIADLGTDTSLEALAELGDFSNFKFPPPSRYKKIGFLDTVLVEAGHTYAVSLNKHNLRGLFIFTVTDYVPNQRVELRYVVREYDIAANASKSSDSGRAMTGSQK
ncbi:MAG: hypothetical protein QOF61_2727, partial [Acidobacteriota bacterium]|nr:hypothetical protein [Acidobacteriota bacterium]